jgi:hypothetical protein
MRRMRNSTHRRYVVQKVGKGYKALNGFDVVKTSNTFEAIVTVLSLLVVVLIAAILLQVSANSIVFFSLHFLAHRPRTLDAG